MLIDRMPATVPLAAIDHRNHRKGAPTTGRALVGPLLTGLATTVLILTRLLVTGDPFDRMWAEDGKMFLAHGDQLSSVTWSYAGYGHLLPRVLGIAGARLPVEHWATYAVLVSSVTVGLIAAFAFAAARRLTGSSTAGAMAALSLGLTPALAFESLGSIANLQWFLLVGVLWALLLPRGALTVAATVVAATAAATTPLVVLLAPAALLVHGPTVLRSRPVQAALLGLTYHVVVKLFGAVEAGGPVRSPGWPDGTPAQLLDHLGGTRASSTLVVAATLALVVVLVAGWQLAPHLRRHVTAAIASGALLLVATTATTGEMASRYIGSASMLVLAGVALAVPAWRWSLPAVGLMCLVALTAYPAHPIKFAGPSWAESVAQWQQACDTGAPWSEIPVSPGGWGVAQVFCDR